MDCCAHNQGLNSIFGEAGARSEAAAYWKKGLDKHTRAVVEAVSAGGMAGASVLEVGGGIGGLHLELLKRGASGATNVDISSAYLAAAQSIAEKLGLRERVAYRLADFAREAASVPAADLVALHRVVCCYPDMPALVTAAAQHARRRLALSYPTGAWYMRLGLKLINIGLWLMRNGVRFYAHAPEAILSTATTASLRLAQRKSSWPWEIVAFERAAPPVA